MTEKVLLGNSFDTFRKHRQNDFFLRGDAKNGEETQINKQIIQSKNDLEEVTSFVLVTAGQNM